MTRLFFFAAFIPDSFSKIIQIELSDLKDPSLCCILPFRYHQTFYPPFPCTDLKRLIRCVTDRFESFFPESLVFTELSLGPYPSDPRLIWAKGSQWSYQHPFQIILSAAIADANKGVMTGIISDSTYFLPHITLGRFLPETVPQYFEPKQISLSIPMQSISLVETIRSSVGSRYEVHAHWSLL